MNNKVYNKENIPGARDVSHLEPPLLLLQWPVWACVGCRGPLLAYVGRRGPVLALVGCHGPALAVVGLRWLCWPLLAVVGLHQPSLGSGRVW